MAREFDSEGDEIPPLLDPGESSEDPDAHITQRESHHESPISDEDESEGDSRRSAEPRSTSATAGTAPAGVPVAPVQTAQLESSQRKSSSSISKMPRKARRPTQREAKAASHMRNIAKRPAARRGTGGVEEPTGDSHYEEGAAAALPPPTFQRGRGGGRGRQGIQSYVNDKIAQGFDQAALRKSLREDGYAPARISQLMNPCAQPSQAR
jgi:hypothetical protein